MKVGDRVKPSVSVRAGQVGTVVCLGQNPALPVAVVFDDSVEWDFKESELEVVGTVPVCGYHGVLWERCSKTSSMRCFKVEEHDEKTTEVTL